MKVLIVVDGVRDWPLDIPGVTVVPARAYLTEPAWGEDRGARVFNLCKSYRYQTLGYYVSLLAEARGHKPLPRTHTLEDLHSRGLVRLLTQDLDEAIQRSLAPIRSERFELSIYFGRNVASRHGRLSRQLFNLIQAPLLRAQFERQGEQWQLMGVRPIAASDIPPQHMEFVVEAATEYFSGRRPAVRRRVATRYDLAILHDPADPEPPSNPRAMRKFEKAALAVGLEPRLITRADFGRLAEFDALFIRDTTFADHYTYRFSRRAEAEGLVVIDDPDSILKCNNKVYLAEVLARHNLPTPRTLLVHRDNVARIVPELGLPCVLKQPDSSFSVGVTKAQAEDELLARVGALLEKSELIIAQEWLPTEFDWRVGVLDRRVLFVCRYYMAPGHWQIVKHGVGRRGYVEGPTVAVAADEAPPEVVRLGLRAANLIGDGFYGVDIKQSGGRLAIIEINDNPNVDAGNEDGVLKDALYREVMAVFLRRIEARKHGTAHGGPQ
ncbi:MAG: RimK family protein [Betaproteobacteria bacterium]|nr:RimK family protein [Betaproteobacteria bacterium]